jgi:hypothetical protein
MGQESRHERSSQAKDARIEQRRTKNEIYAEYGKYSITSSNDEYDAA